MYCRSCGKSIPADATYCPWCGNATSVQAHQPSVEASIQERNEQNKSFWKTVLAALYLTLVLVGFATLRARRETEWAGAIGYETGVAILPCLGVLLYYYFRPREKRSSARTLSVIASFIVIANIISIGNDKPHLTAADVPIVAKEAAGLIPISYPEDNGRTAVRNYFKDIIAQNKDYESKLATINFETLFTPQSYLDHEKAEEIIVEIDDAIRIDEGQEAALHEIAERLRTRINSLDWSEDEKRKFLEGFNTKYQEGEASRTELLNSEKDWLNSVRDLYVLALDNQKYFQHSGNDIVITNSKVLDAFNSQITHDDELREKYQKLLKEFQQNQKQKLATLGVSAKDFGTSQ